jgi:hypothetical protein
MECITRSGEAAQNDEAKPQGNDWGPTDIKGYWSVIREGDDWKIRMLTSNTTPVSAGTGTATPTPTTTPSGK